MERMLPNVIGVGGVVRINGEIITIASIRRSLPLAVIAKAQAK